MSTADQLTKTRYELRIFEDGRLDCKQCASRQDALDAFERVKGTHQATYVVRVDEVVIAAGFAMRREPSDA